MPPRRQVASRCERLMGWYGYRAATDVATGIRLGGTPAGTTGWLAEWRRADDAARRAVDQVLDEHDRPVAAGQPLRPEWFKAPQAITPGEPVRVNLMGQGFSITLDGKALNGAGLGESVRVQLSTGRTVGGTLRASRLVEVGL